MAKSRRVAQLQKEEGAAINDEDVEGVVAGVGLAENDVFGGEAEVITDDAAADMIHGAMAEEWQAHTDSLLEAYRTPVQQRMHESDEAPTQAQLRQLEQEGLL